MGGCCGAAGWSERTVGEPDSGDLLLVKLQLSLYEAMFNSKRLALVEFVSVFYWHAM